LSGEHLSFPITALTNRAMNMESHSIIPTGKWHRVYMNGLLADRIKPGRLFIDYCSLILINYHLSIINLDRTAVL